MEFFLAITSSFLLSFSALKFLRPFAIKVGLVDKPCTRKQHLGHVPLIGGIAVFFGVLVSSSIWLSVSAELVTYLITAAAMVCLGALDDKFDLSVGLRIGFQIFIATFMIVLADKYIINLGDLFLVGDIHLKYIGFFFTYVAVIAMINAFNMVDGIDGLLGLVSINALGAIAVLLLIKGQENLFTILIIAALIPYLIFNLGVFGTRYRKVFMGDAGSMFIGFTVVWLLVLNTQGESAGFRPVTALWVVSIPLMDMASIIIRRLKKGGSPFRADREHLHHILLRLGFSANHTLYIIISFSIVFSTVGILAEWLNIHESIMFNSFILAFFLYNYLIQNIWQLRKNLKKMKVKIRRQKMASY